MNTDDIDVSRRRAFLAATGLGLVATGFGGASAQSAPTTRRALTPQLTEGPFYLDLDLQRADIVESRRGVPVEWRIALADAEGRPLDAQRVDLWHCDAAGYYSGFEGQGPRREVSTIGRTFLRGSVRSGGDGIATFRSIYPGWYDGRTAHVHVKVFSGQRVVLTSQLFLPDALSEFVYTNVAPYRRLDVRDTLNRDDDLAIAGGDAAFASVREQPGRYVAEALLVVDPNAKPVERPLGRPDGDGPRGGFSVGGGGGAGGGGMRGGAGGGLGGTGAGLAAAVGAVRRPADRRANTS